jgi:hypothetical protein
MHEGHIHPSMKVWTFQMSKLHIIGKHKLDLHKQNPHNSTVWRKIETIFHTTTVDNLKR